MICNSFVRCIFDYWLGKILIIFFYTILDLHIGSGVLLQNDPIYLILAEKLCFIIVKIRICQQNYFTKRKRMNKLGNFGWF